MEAVSSVSLVGASQAKTSRSPWTFSCRLFTQKDEGDIQLAAPLVVFGGSDAVFTSSCAGEDKQDMASLHAVTRGDSALLLAGSSHD